MGHWREAAEIQLEKKKEKLRQYADISKKDYQVQRIWV